MVSPPSSPSVSPRHSSAEPSQSTPREEAAMQVFIRTPSGTTTTLTIPSSTSIATVKSLVALQVPSAIPSANTSLTFAGRHLDAPEKTLFEYGISASSTLQLSIPLPGGGVEEPQASAGETAPKMTATTEAAATAATPEPQAKAGSPAPKPKSASSGAPKRKGPRCGAAGCNALAQRIVGECGFCGGNYCGKHRLLESHSCSGLETAKQESKDQNKEKLERERTMMTTGLGV